MSALAGLSVAANVFQVIEFASAVFSTGKKLYELFDKARSALSSITLLLQELQRLLSIVAYIHVVITEHASSPFTHTLPNINTILTLIDKDFEYLNGLIGQTIVSTSQGWFSSIQNGVRWALKDHEIASTRHRLARYTHELNTILSITGRRNDIVICTELQSVAMAQKSMATVQQHMVTRLSNIESSIRPPGTTVHPNATSTQIQVRSRRRAGGARPPRLSAHDKPRNLIKSTPSVAETDTAPFSIRFKAPARVKIHEQPDKSLAFDTGNIEPHHITNQVLLLRDSITVDFDKIRSRDNSSAGVAQITHLQKLFDQVVTLTHLASAEHILRKYGNSSGIARYPLCEMAANGLPSQDTDLALVQYTTPSVYLEEKSTSLQTKLGWVRARTLVAECNSYLRILAFTFEHFGLADHDLISFTVEFVSRELSEYHPSPRSIFDPNPHFGQEEVFPDLAQKLDGEIQFCIKSTNNSIQFYDSPHQGAYNVNQLCVSDRVLAKGMASFLASDRWLYMDGGDRRRLSTTYFQDDIATESSVDLWWELQEGHGELGLELRNPNSGLLEYPPPKTRKVQWLFSSWPNDDDTVD